MAMAATENAAMENVLSLETITNRFSAPITEEHAFAVIYECMKSLAKVLSAAEAAATFSGKAAAFSSSSLGSGGKKGNREIRMSPPPPLAVVSGTADIMLRKDGTVHGSTFVEAKSAGEAGKLASGMSAMYLSRGKERNSRVWIQGQQILSDRRFLLFSMWNSIIRSFS